MRRAGKMAATVLDRLCKLVNPGMSTLEIDELGGELMQELGVKSACKDIALARKSSHLTRVYP